MACLAELFAESKQKRIQRLAGSKRSSSALADNVSEKVLKRRKLMEEAQRALADAEDNSNDSGSSDRVPSQQILGNIPAPLASLPRSSVAQPTAGDVANSASSTRDPLYLQAEMVLDLFMTTAETPEDESSLSPHSIKQEHGMYDSSASALSILSHATAIAI
jgi:hypothetical protein